MAGRVAALVCLCVWVTAEASTSPALVRTLPTSSFRNVVIRPDGSSLAVVREGVILQDAAGAQKYITRLKGNQRVSLSQEGACYGVTTYADNAPSTLRAHAFELYDEGGTRRYRLEKPEASEFVVSDDGRWVVGIAGGEEMHQSRLRLFDAQGALVTSWDVPYLSDLVLPEGSTRFFAASKGVLSAYDFAASEPHPIGRFEAFGTGAGGRYVALCGAGSLALYQEEKLVFTAASEVTRPISVAISHDGGYIAVAGGDRLELFERESKARLWTVTSGQNELRFISVDLAGGPDALLAGLDFDAGIDAGANRHTRGAVFLIDRAGNLLWRDDLTYSEWGIRYPKVRFLGTDRLFEVELAAEIRRYSLPEAP